MWVVSILSAVILSCYINYQVREYDSIFNIRLVRYIPLTIFINYLYWYSYKNCSSYFICSMISMISLAIISLNIDIIILKEMKYNIYNQVGIIFIMVGLILLYWRN